MFLGHYAAAVAIKAADRRIPLSALFISVQLVDLAWASLVLAGVERVRIVPGFTESNPLDLYYMPWSHGLLPAVGWALLAGLLWTLARGRGAASGSALLVGLAVFSHWPSDWVVHARDLPLWDDRHKVGLGLWNHFELALALEVGMFALATALYFRATRPAGRAGWWAVPLLGLLVVGAQLATLKGPTPSSPAAVAAMGLGGFLLLGGLAHWADRKRV